MYVQGVPNSTSQAHHLQTERKQKFQYESLEGILRQFFSWHFGNYRNDMNNFVNKVFFCLKIINLNIQ